MPTPASPAGGVSVRRLRRAKTDGSWTCSPIAEVRRAHPEKLVAIASSRISVAVSPTSTRRTTSTGCEKCCADRRHQAQYRRVQPLGRQLARVAAGRRRIAVRRERRGRRGRHRRVDEDDREHRAAQRSAARSARGPWPGRPAGQLLQAGVADHRDREREGQRVPGRLDAQVDVLASASARATAGPARARPGPPGRSGRAPPDDRRRAVSRRCAGPAGRP